MLLALDLTGVNRGEVIRLWIFLACLFQVPTAYVCVRLRESRCLRDRADADDRSVGAGHGDYRLRRPLSPLFRPNAQKAPKLRGLRGRFSGAWRMRSRTDGLS